jgi:hypothetical protein
VKQQNTWSTLDRLDVFGMRYMIDDSVVVIHAVVAYWNYTQEMTSGSLLLHHSVFRGYSFSFFSHVYLKMQTTSGRQQLPMVAWTYTQEEMLGSLLVHHDLFHGYSFSFFSRVHPEMQTTSGRQQLPMVAWFYTQEEMLESLLLHHDLFRGYSFSFFSRACAEMQTTSGCQQLPMVAWFYTQEEMLGSWLLHHDVLHGYSFSFFCRVCWEMQTTRRRQLPLQMDSHVTNSLVDCEILLVAAKLEASYNCLQKVHNHESCSWKRQLASTEEYAEGNGIRKWRCQEWGTLGSVL